MSRSFALSYAADTRGPPLARRRPARYELTGEQKHEPAAQTAPSRAPARCRSAPTPRSSQPFPSTTHHAPAARLHAARRRSDSPNTSYSSLRALELPRNDYAPIP